MSNSYLKKGKFYSFHCGIYSDTIIFSCMGKPDVDSGYIPNDQSDFDNYVSNFEKSFLKKLNQMIKGVVKK